MAIDFQQVYQKIQEIGAQVQERQRTLSERQSQARRLLQENADNLDGLRYKVQKAREVDPNLRCALPLNEPLNFHAAPPDLPLQATLIAADGSQINPDRHSAIQYGLINVGAIILRLNSGQAPVIRTDSHLLFEDELFTPSGNPLTEGMVALRRDTKEREKLLTLTSEFNGDGAPVITFTDGPIELWGEKDGENAGDFEKNLNSYLSILSQLQERGVTTAGYVDKPAADLVIRLLELAQATDNDLQKLREYHPLRGVSDRWLFGEKKDPLLKPGERSAVFAFQSRAEKHYTQGLALHFFYLNAGTEGRPWPVRVEVPRWVVDEPEKLGHLHAVLVSQCRMLGEKPYPYLLHRAHETAVVSFQEKQQVDQMLDLELRRSGSEMDEGSPKQSAKDRAGRTGYK
jgi:hypothetical protein